MHFFIKQVITFNYFFTLLRAFPHNIRCTTVAFDSDISVGRLYITLDMEIHSNYRQPGSELNQTEPCSEHFK